MSTIKPQNAKGTRDFGPQQMKRIDYIFETIAKNFEAYGFMKIATPAVEKLDVLTGKYVGLKFKYENEDYSVINDDEVVAIVPEPDKIKHR